MARRICQKRMVAECNDGFMIDVRRFLKGDEEGPESICRADEAESKSSGLINYIASHDGFTYVTWYLMKNVTMKITASRTVTEECRITAGTAEKKEKAAKRKFLQTSKSRRMKMHGVCC